MYKRQIYCDDFLKAIGYNFKPKADNLELIKKNQKAYLEHTEGLWSKDDVIDSLENQFILMVNTFMK